MKKILLSSLLITSSYYSKSQGILDEILTGSPSVLTEKKTQPIKTQSSATTSYPLDGLKILKPENGITSPIPNMQINKVQTGNNLPTYELTKRNSQGIMIPTHRVITYPDHTKLIPIINGIPDLSKTIIIKK